MTRRLVLAAALVMASVVTAAPADATLPAGPYFLLDNQREPCGLTATRDPAGSDAAHVGVLDGGPVLLADEQGNVHRGSMTCTVRSGEANNTHSAPYAAAATSVRTTGVVMLPPAPVSFDATDPHVFTCASVFVEGEGTYYGSTAIDMYGGIYGTYWTQDPSIPCHGSIDVDGGLVLMLYTLVDEVLDLAESVEREVVDPAMCPVVAALAGQYGSVVINGQGDVAIDGSNVRDCPPYEWSS